MSAPRKCAACPRELTRRRTESAEIFAARAHCSRECSIALRGDRHPWRRWSVHNMRERRADAASRFIERNGTRGS